LKNIQPSLKHGHSAQEISKRLASQHKHSFLRDWVYGGMDGAVTTFAVVSSVIGAALANHIIIILGVANLIADGFSMAAANFLSTKAEEEQYHLYKTYEQQQIENIPEGETEEIRVIFRNKGFHGKALESIVTQITSDKKLWVDTMMQEEYGLSSSTRSPYKAALNTFIAFFIFGSVPLLPFIIATRYMFISACIATGIVFVLIGSLKSKWSIHAWWRSVLTTLAIGACAASIAYIIGVTFHHFMLR